MQFFALFCIYSLHKCYQCILLHSLKLYCYVYNDILRRTPQDLPPRNICNVSAGVTQLSTRLTSRHTPTPLHQSCNSRLLLLELFLLLLFLLLPLLLILKPTAASHCKTSQRKNENEIYILHVHFNTHLPVCTLAESCVTSLCSEFWDVAFFILEANISYSCCSFSTAVIKM